MSSTLDENQLELFRLNARLGILEGMLLRSYVSVPVLLGRLDFAASSAATLEALEESAKLADRVYLSDPALAGIDASQRALLADEFREVVEDLKSSVVALYESVRPKRET